MTFKGDREDLQRVLFMNCPFEWLNMLPRSEGLLDKTINFREPCHLTIRHGR